MADRRPTAEVVKEMPPGLPGTASIVDRARSENFPVALRMLPARVRVDLVAVYGFARLADQIGDEYEGDRLAALDWLEADLERTTTTGAQHPLVAGLTPTIRSHGLDLQPFRDLIEANRRDQVQHRYATFDELLGYCRLSANPVGRIVLAIFETDHPRAVELSDRVCSGLQVVEHLQDVAEDMAAGRCYLPTADLARCKCSEDELRQPSAAPALRAVVALEHGRAATLLEGGEDLAAELALQPRFAVAGFVAGGRAALDAIADADYDVLAVRCRPSRRDLAGHATALLWRARRRRPRSGP
jgi:squalene synthase HpnC